MSALICLCTSKFSKSAHAKTLVKHLEFGNFTEVTFKRNAIEQSRHKSGAGPSFWAGVYVLFMLRSEGVSVVFNKEMHATCALWRLTGP